MSKDIVYREDAIKAVWGEDINPSEDGVVFEAQSHIDRDIRLIPSADRPKGEWIDEADKYDASFGIHDYRCSNCNSYADEHIGGHEWYTMYKPNYCPYCGADMRKESE